MTVTQRDLFIEIESLYNQCTLEGQPVRLAWLTHEIVSLHSAIAGDDTDWYRLCAYEHVRDTGRQVIRSKKDDGETDPQMLLPGFRHLQKSYVVDRDGDQCSIPIDQLSDAEIGAKIDELERMAAGCVEHAEELRRYRQQRKVAAR